MKCIAYKYLVVPIAAGALLSSSMAMSATTITLVGTIANLCVLTLATPGVLGVSSTGTLLGSQQTGGLAATLTVVATGSPPTIAFTAPTLTGSAASVSGATNELSYSSGGGASRGLDATAYSYTMTGLLDSVTVNGRVTNTAGFATGVYTLSTTATCSQ